MKSPTPSIQYPRRRIQRGLLRRLGRVIVPLLTQIEIHGLENFPDHGPLIVAGNHIAAMEVVMMVVYAPGPVELLGTGDIAPPPAINALGKFYGFIPINRGNMDRQALVQALEVLRQDGVLGIFPEGGIWDPGAMQAKRGVAWLSQRTETPILPIGFGGLEGALDATLKLKRPPLVMNVGELMPPVTVPPHVPRKQALKQAADEIMEEVRRLIPERYRGQQVNIADERFRLEIDVRDQDGHKVPIPEAYTISHADPLTKFFYRPAILRIFSRDLHLPVQALQQITQDPPAEEIVAAVNQILRYVKEENPGFFTYRFEHEEGLGMEAGLRELRNLAAWAAQAGYELSIRPSRRYRVPERGDQEVVETNPDKPPVW